jgi:hypothetical protein
MRFRTAAFRGMAVADEPHAAPFRAEGFADTPYHDEYG